MDRPVKILHPTDYAGYSQREMWLALNDTFGEGAPIQLRAPTDEACEQIPLFRQVGHLIKMLGEGGELKLTQAGYLPLKVVGELYRLGVPDKMVEEEGFVFHSEAQCESVPVAREVARLIGAVKKRNNKLSLTAKGKKMLADKPALAAAIITATCTTLQTAFMDWYEQEATGTFETGFVLLLLNKYGAEQRPVEFYYDQCLSAFHDLRSEYEALHPFTLRLFSRRLLHLGVIELAEHKIGEWKTEDLVAKTPLFDKPFIFLPPQ